MLEPPACNQDQGIILVCLFFRDNIGYRHERGLAPGKLLGVKQRSTRMPLGRTRPDLACVADSPVGYTAVGRGHLLDFSHDLLGAGIYHGVTHGLGNKTYYFPVCL